MRYDASCHVVAYHTLTRRRVAAHCLICHDTLSRLPRHTRYCYAVDAMFDIEHAAASSAMRIRKDMRGVTRAHAMLAPRHACYAIV